jgi:hypothetical protein
VSTMDERDGGAVDTTRISPVVADGDDITVVTASGPPRSSSDRTRLRIIAGAVAAVVLLVVGIAMASRNSSSPPVVKTTSPTTTRIAAKAPTPRVPINVTVPVGPPTPIASVAPTTLTSPPASVVVPPVTQPSVTQPPVVTTVPAPKQYGPSVLTWTAPASLTIPAGKTIALSVTAHNPSNGTVTLPHPLSCTPRLDHGEMCAQAVQLISAGQSASATYTIDATGTTPGHYTLVIEGVLTVPVTVS